MGVALLIVERHIPQRPAKKWYEARTVGDEDVGPGVRRDVVSVAPQNSLVIQIIPDRYVVVF